MKRSWFGFLVLLLIAAGLEAADLRMLKARPVAKLPDLTVVGIGLDKRCRVTVKVRNLGPGAVPAGVWTARGPNSSGIFIYRDGKPWGGAAIWKFDPRKALSRPGGTVAYTSKLQIRGASKITAVIDDKRKIREKNEGNNKASDKLSCRSVSSKPAPKAPMRRVPPARTGVEPMPPRSTSPMVRRPGFQRGAMLAAPKAEQETEPQQQDGTGDQGSGQPAGAPPGVIVTETLTFTGGDPSQQPPAEPTENQPPPEPFVPKVINTDKLEFTGG